MYWKWPGPHTETAAHVHFQQTDPPQKLIRLILSFLAQVGTVRGPTYCEDLMSVPSAGHMLKNDKVIFQKAMDFLHSQDC